MPSFSVSYLHDDRFVTRAVRESWWPPARRRAATRLLWFALAAAAMLVAAESLPGSTPSAAMRVIMLAPVALLLVGMAGMGLVLLLLPRWLQRRLRRLPDRTVRVTFDDDGLDYATAHERYRAVWSEVQSIEPLESLWRLRLRNGTQLVLPFAAADAELAAWLAARTTSIGSA
ncbi:MAG: hypothetical protein MUC86_05325 [Burkholderiaceae bacterium]|jgi:hypothetical protein|nr:hypothetical protein [Burkholderiaceae bacterium]